MKKAIIVILFVLAALSGIGVGYLAFKHFNKPKIPKTEINELKVVSKYEVQTPEYFSEKPEKNAFYIDSEEEFNNFMRLYSDKIESYKEHLTDDTVMFIHTVEVSSGSDRITLRSVRLENNRLVFDEVYDAPEASTADMAFWYIIAVVKKDTIKDVNYSDWVKPSTLIK